mgnify:CR=1 FL=1
MHFRINTLKKFEISTFNFIYSYKNKKIYWLDHCSNGRVSVSAEEHLKHGDNICKRKRKTLTNQTTVNISITKA